MLRFINDSIRSIYAFELTDPPEPWVEPDTAIPSTSSSSSGCSSGSCTDQPMESSPSSTSLSMGSIAEEICTICLEENDGDLKKHNETNCKLIMCDSCIEVWLCPFYYYIFFIIRSFLIHLWCKYTSTLLT